MMLSAEIVERGRMFFSGVVGGASRRQFSENLFEEYRSFIYEIKLLLLIGVGNSYCIIVDVKIYGYLDIL